MPPIHEDEVQRAGLGDGRHRAEHRPEEVGERDARHLAGGHRELAVAAARGDVAVDAHVVRRIGDDRAGAIAVEEPGVVALAARVAAQQAVRSERP